ncbi:hypothetical protein [Fimbriimonas ginsengisoli]|uniref:Uncharacterized protein n=1 Tax=Fimbriimonas ginsengisoli Gsoil 348 TaxID=661478 RepID=A0A068NL73_FIMGI|nr:hypothetical protein [Fimbriimonas ginsengisoli]AIE83510.1 hypothetical protein OP10G_0142 [Fimbriimonas ginsengisoli Gsoil 348]
MPSSFIAARQKRVEDPVLPDDPIESEIHRWVYTMDRRARGVLWFIAICFLLVLTALLGTLIKERTENARLEAGATIGDRP